jgi:Flp pilus assembly protein TadG
MMQRNLRRNISNQRPPTCRRPGAAVVELAVVAPVFFLLIFGLVELGRTIMVQHALTEAARAGCREAILSTTINAEDADQAARQHLTAYMPGADTSTCRVDISPSDLSMVERGTEITAIVEVNCSEVSWISPNYMKNKVLRGEATMKRE